jgi:tripartite-type tricarboxylate transporter receptor subunit TctC
MKKIMTLALASLALAASVGAQAAQWPDKPVKIVVPYPPGGNVDTAARVIAPGLQEAFGQSFIVENRPGAGGMIAAEYVARSEPDGYTLFMAANGPLLYSPLIFGRHSYTWKKDFVPISTVSLTPMVLEVNPSVPIKSVGELVAMAKKEPGKLNMASPGAGTSNHLLSELLQAKTGATWTTIHYKGNAPATTDLLAGQVQFAFDQVSVALPFIKEHKLRPLAVSSEQRLPQLPDVPTLEESGLKGVHAETFTGLLAPAGTPQDIANRVSAALQKILQEKNVVQKFDAIGARAQASTPEQFVQRLQHEDSVWIPVIKNAHISAR